MDPNCIFCKLVKKEIETVVIYEDNETIAFLDTNPAGTLVGHAVVALKNHYPNINAVPIEELCKLIRIVKLLAPAVKEVSGAAALNILENDGKEAGQLVPHFHFHIIPRKFGDGIHFDENRRAPKPMERVETAKAMKEILEKQKKP